ncbi:MAG: aminotransferase class IV [bacterium]|jgi:4-amino-4-deoxychorismate lyase
MMVKLLETIRYEKGNFDNLELHQERMNRSRFSIFQCKDDLRLKDFLNREFQGAMKTISSGEIKTDPDTSIPDDIIFKCRIIYGEDIEKIEVVPYAMPVIRSLKVIRDDTINYAYKYANRKELKKLYSHKEKCDDIMIVKQGQLTDTYYANLLFYNGKYWVTPENPLLKGTRRASLLLKGWISTEPLVIGDLARFQKARLVNAMIRFEDHLDIEINNIEL